MKVEAAHAPKMSAAVFQSTRYNMLEDLNRQVPTI